MSGAARPRRTGRNGCATARSVWPLMPRKGVMGHPPASGGDVERPATGARMRMAEWLSGASRTSQVDGRLEHHGRRPRGQIEARELSFAFEASRVRRAGRRARPKESTRTETVSRLSVAAVSPFRGACRGRCQWREPHSCSRPSASDPAERFPLTSTPHRGSPWPGLSSVNVPSARFPSS